jgi:hypothetical protein
MSTAPQEPHMSTYDLTDTELAHFHGTEQWYRHSVVKSVL